MVRLLTYLIAVELHAGLTLSILIAQRGTHQAPAAPATGGSGTRLAVDARDALGDSLDWLERHLSRQPCACSAFVEDPDEVIASAALTALAFLRSKRGVPDMGAAVAISLAFVGSRQDSSGRFGRSERAHAIATASLCAGDGVSQFEEIQRAAQVITSDPAFARDPATAALAALALDAAGQRDWIATVAEHHFARVGRRRATDANPYDLLALCILASIRNDPRLAQCRAAAEARMRTGPYDPETELLAALALPPDAPSRRRHRAALLAGQERSG